MDGQARELGTVHDSILAAWGVGHRFIEAIPGERVHMLEHGEGSPLVMLHGSGPTSLHLLPLISKITGSAVTAIDRPGFGLSDPHGWTGPRREAAVGWLEAVLDHLAIPTVDLLGSSAGGTWAMWFALALPDRVDRLVLLGAPPALSATTPPQPLRMVASIDPSNPPQQPPPSRESVIGSMAAMGEGDTVVRYPDLVEAMVIAGRDATSGRASLDELRSLIAPDGWRADIRMGVDELGSLTVPVHLIWGKRDPLGGEAAARTVADSIPRSTLELLDAGHAPWLGHPDAVAAHIDRALAVPSD